jgi:small subunit ribosomal protein S1
MSKNKRFAPEISSDFFSGEDFASLYQQKADVVQEGSVVQGTVVGVEKEVVIVDVGLKNEGRIPVTEFSLATDLPLPEVGDLVKVYVEKIEGYNGRTILSREKAIREESWEHLEAALAEARTVDGVIFGRVKGGFTVDLSGVVAFLPGSQVDVRPIKDVGPLMDIVQPFQILKMDKKLGNIVVSRRAIMEESRMEARNEMLDTIKEGMQLKGVVKNIVNYGAFIDLGKVDGLLHVTDISWSRINHPSEVLSIGQEIDVVVIKFNDETKRISLGMKQLESNPWRGISEQFPVNKVMTGKISNIADYGAFIELKPGIEGLVHTSEISWTKTTQHPKKLLSIGQEVKFVILEVDEEKHRISLSVKKCMSNPWQTFADSHKVGDVITGQIRNVADFGMFVALDEDIDGLVHASDISWSGSGEAELKNYKKGQEIECKVMSMDVAKERISLGIKQLGDDPYVAAFDGYEKGAVVSCVVASTNKDGVEVNVDDKFITTIKKADLSSDKEDQRSDRFAVGDKIEAKIISFDKVNRKITLSIKALELDERKKAMQEHSGDAGSSIGDILGEAMNQAKAAEENK